MSNVIMIEYYILGRVDDDIDSKIGMFSLSVFCISGID